jgi:hypothetical protein
MFECVRQSRYICRLFFLTYGLKTGLASPVDETHKSDWTTLASALSFATTSMNDRAGISESSLEDGMYVEPEPDMIG